MESPPLSAPIWVDSPDAFQDLVRELNGCTIIAVDTESNGLHAYQEQVCLMQFSADGKDYLVDPLALKDLSTLAGVFANPDIEKVFHAAEYDLICMKRDFGFEFVSIFDTMQAGRILGRGAVGLSSMLKEGFGVILDKRYQRADWGERPLNTAMQSYARLDTHYLIPLRNRLKADLVKTGLLELAEEDFRRVCQVQAGGLQSANSGNCWKVAGATHLKPVQAAVLHELCAYREDYARKLDRPVFKVLSNNTLLQIALDCPTRREELLRVEGVTPFVIRRHGDQLLQAVQRGLKSAPRYRPNRDHPDMEFLGRLDTLRQWRKQAGLALGVESDVVLPRDLLEEIAQVNPTCLGDLEKILISTPWRFNRYGREILRTLGR